MMIRLLTVILLAFMPNQIFGSVQFLYNPNCSISECMNDTLPGVYYASYTVDDRKLHMIYSSLDELTITMFETDLKNDVLFNYTELFARNYRGAIQFTGDKPTISFTIVLRRLIQFNDTDDNGVLNSADNITAIYYLKDLSVSNETDQINCTVKPKFQLLFPSLNGSLNIDIFYPGETYRDTKFPKLRTASKSFYINIALQANQYSETNIRFAFEFYIISPAAEGVKIFSSRYIDDHFTPGIFNVWQMRSLSSMYPSSMLWKPVVYQSEERSIEENTLMQIYQVYNNITYNSTFDQGIFYSILPRPVISSLNVSLGQAKDGFFSKTNYSFIQFTAGIDLLETDSTKTFVSVALIVSLALPCLVGLVALISIIKRRFSQKSSSNYETLHN